MAFSLSAVTGGSGARVHVVNGGVGRPIDYLAASSSRKAQKAKRKAIAASTDGLRLVQDSDFPEASTRVKSTRDGNYLIATGVYKPRIKVLDLTTLGMKFERTTDAETIDFEILSESGWEKTIHVQTDRQVEIHNQKAAYFRTRIPRPGRCVAYHFPSCDAFIGAEGSHLFRLNLEQGRFLAPFELAADVLGVNALDVNPVHGLLSVGTDRSEGGGTVEMWDPRMRTRAATLALPNTRLAGLAASSVGDYLPGVDDARSTGSVSVTALSSRVDGLNLAVGTGSGHTLLYDLRSPRPYVLKDQGYGEPIKRLQWVDVEGLPHLASVDAHVLKIWAARAEAAESAQPNFVSVEPPAKINDMHILPGSGLVWLANEQPAMTAYHIPELGPAPSWCRFLDNVADDAEAATGEVANVYEDFKFVDRQEISSLNLDHLIGTNALRPYMHGFFIDLRLYTKARAIANPFAYAEHREKLIADKLERERESRIRSAPGAAGKKAATTTTTGAEPVSTKVKVNQDLLDRIAARERKDAIRADVQAKAKARAAAMAIDEADDDAAAVVGPNAADEDDDEDADAEAKKQATAQSLLTDDRFSALFNDPEFEVDPTSREFALINPSEAHRAIARAAERRLDGEVESDVEEDEDVPDEDAESDSSEDAQLVKYVAPPRQKRRRDIEPVRAVPTPVAGPSRPKLVVERDSTAAPAQSSSGARTLGEKLAVAGPSSSKRKGKARATNADADDDGGIMRPLADGGMEYSFEPRTTASKSNSERRSALSAAKAKSSIVGAGLQRGSDAAEQQRREDEDRLLADEAGSGRKRRRQVARSASKGVMRRTVG